MKPGRVIGGDEHDARTLGQQIVEDARAEADRLREAARAEIGQMRRDAETLAGRIVQDARIEAARMDAERLRARTSDEAGAAGSVDEVIGLVIRATVPGAALGEVVEVEIARRGGGPLLAEVVGFRGEQAVLLPLGEVAG
ncbi:MAG TPA: hypothetical protein VF469_21335, partial [Kofleriaceae bacterium]